MKTHADRKKTSTVRESLLSEIWRGQWLHKGPFPASDSRMVSVRSTGIENKDSGPDFLGATIVLDDEIVSGDVELHVKSSDWRSHGHHRDPHFNGVVLQVVLWDDAKSPAQLQNGNSIPTLPLHDYLNGSMDDLTVRAEVSQSPVLPCRNAGDVFGDRLLGELLDQYGSERFHIKSAYFQVELILEEPEEVLYQGMMGALGYTKNKKAFQQLSRLLPFGILKNITQQHASENRVDTLQAVFLGGAGLLPSQCDGKSKMGNSVNASELDGIWKTLKTTTSMQYSDWHFFRMHPRNFPTSRLLAAGHLFDRYMDRGLLDGIVDLVKNADSRNSASSIENAFSVPDLLGQGRVREIIVNVVLPFLIALAETQKNEGLNQNVRNIYQSFPRLGENQITRFLSELYWNGKNTRIVNSAKRQQGMIHLYKTFCQEQRCAVCPINVDD